MMTWKKGTETCFLNFYNALYITVQTHNKAFKSDSQRMAFFISLLGFVFTVIRFSFVVALLTP
ncbi:hypothetical protein FMH15_24005 [Vibrio alginolyticus]|nr:hypothetical protein [Vibrio alginolyticus]